MKIYEYPWDKRPDGISGCVLALGFFDGMHAAHRDLISFAASEARSLGMPLGIFTFKPTGKIKPDSERIYSEHDKIALMQSLGTDFIINADFSRLCDATAEDFVRDVIARDIGASTCVVGYNFRFGKGAAAGADDLVALMREVGKNALIREEFEIDGTAVSASRIRELIKIGDMETARRLLGMPYFIRGRVSHGNRDGRRIGYPTINISIQDGALVPRLGVYRSAVEVDGELHPAITNIGTCPTFKERQVHSETYILDFEGDLYGREMRVYLLEFLRDERKFTSPEQLAQQIKHDTQMILDKKGDLTWQALGLS